MSRNLKLTKDLIKEICGFVENGNTFKNACILSDVSESIFYEWKKHGTEDSRAGKQSIFKDFLESIKKAEATFKAYHVQQIMKAAKNSKHWHASAWLLERKYPGEFGRKESISFKGNFNVKNFDIELTVEEQKEYKKRVKDMYGEEAFEIEEN